LYQEGTAERGEALYKEYTDECEVTTQPLTPGLPVNVDLMRFLDTQIHPVKPRKQQGDSPHLKSSIPPTQEDGNRDFLDYVLGNKWIIYDYFMSCLYCCTHPEIEEIDTTDDTAHGTYVVKPLVVSL